MHPFIDNTHSRKEKMALLLQKTYYVNSIHCKGQMMPCYSISNNGILKTCPVSEQHSGGIDQDGRKCQCEGQADQTLPRPAQFCSCYCLLCVNGRAVLRVGQTSVSVFYLLNPSPLVIFFFLMSDLKRKACKYNDYHMDSHLHQEPPCLSRLALAAPHMSQPLGGWILT